MEHDVETVSRWRRWEYAVRLWLATTVTGSVVKVGLGAGLGWVALNTAGWHPLLAVVVTVSVPVLINALNPADGRYGMGKDVLDPADPDE